MKKKKPKCLYLPPELIYTDEFHRVIVEDHYNIYSNVNKYVWYHTMIDVCAGHTQSNIRSFCQAAYGICEVKYSDREDLFAALLYLDNSLSFLPSNFTDYSSCEYYEYLKGRYYFYRPTRWIFDKKLILISSRQTVTGE